MCEMPAVCATRALWDLVPRGPWGANPALSTIEDVLPSTSKPTTPPSEPTASHAIREDDAANAADEPKTASTEIPDLSSSVVVLESGDSDSSPTRELNLETRDLTWTRALNDSDSTRTRALGTRT